MRSYETYGALIEGYLKGCVPVCVARSVASGVRQCLDMDSPDTADKLNHNDLIDIRDEVIKQELNNFLEAFGGYIYFVETEDDLKLIQAIDFTDYKSKSIVEFVQSWDIADYVMGNKSNNWFEFWMGTNNGGGDAFYVPEQFWVQARVEEHRSVNQT